MKKYTKEVISVVWGGCQWLLIWRSGASSLLNIIINKLLHYKPLPGFSQANATSCFNWIWSNWNLRGTHFSSSNFCFLFDEHLITRLRLYQTGCKCSKSRAGNLCTREYSALRFFGFGGGFISDHLCIEGIQCIQCIGGRKLKACYK